MINDSDSDSDSDSDFEDVAEKDKGADHRQKIIEIFTGKDKKLTNLVPVTKDRIIFSQKRDDEREVATAMYRLARRMPSIKI